MKLKEAFEKSTGKPFELISGKGTCFHEGNRVAIQKTSIDGEEECAETVAELWPADKKVDLTDGALLVHCYNHFQEVVEALARVSSKEDKTIRNLLVKVNNVRV